MRPIALPLHRGSVEAGSAADRPPAGSRYVIKGGTVLTMDAAIGSFVMADVLVDGSRIAEVAPTIEAAAEIVDASGMIVIPGLVDAHRHHWSGMFKCCIPNADGGDYSRFAERLMPALRESDVYDITQLTNLSALDCGITSILDYMHGSRTPDMTDAAVLAHRESGIRVVFAFATPRSEHMDPKFHLTGQGRRNADGDGAASHHPDYLAELQRKFFTGSDQLVTLRLGTPLSSSNYAFARAHDVPIISDAVYGGPTPIRPVDAAPRLREMAEAGELGPDVTLIHCTSLPDDVFRLFADHGVGIVLVPTSDATLRGLGDSIPPIQKVMDFGLMGRTGLSVDIEVALSPDHFSQMRAIFTIQRVFANSAWASNAPEPPRNITVQEVLALATVGGSTAIGNGAKCGTLTPGKEADIVLIRTNDLATGPLNNAFGTVVVGAGVNNVDTVIVGGRPRKWRGQLLDGDHRALLDRVRQSRDYLADKAGVWSAESIVA